MLEFLLMILAVIVGIPVFFFIVLLSCIVTGSSVDPDDNGLLKTKKQKEEWRKEKLAKHNIEL
ncbi:MULTISPECIES: hypothetical protein [Acinetobacter calcoaceticus/baumannii complex]|uniref:Uncharacterized protein n=1 Tax=Acinetobacter baumannii TaxID=470 RepID=A0A7D6ZX64_ACIBA|nr:MULTISPECIES: hypothetical protein [Acinetobacter calcoaceticus/baumannii complex]EXB39837.1 hypothetical protein J540_3727 [Acinetobacter baumannii 1440422]AIS07644.1 hypothetical protein LX00_14985 [Acinetobacter baumannii]EHZ7611254.1 hypothetical protein [Acinetobacter baumannii]EJX0977196.1 hypothetical protein [Acinetobacter baumannii]EKD2867224.1 hypothetical protein [Acinetobacter baumannii]